VEGEARKEIVYLMFDPGDRRKEKKNMKVKKMEKCHSLQKICFKLE
jgi:hypothetical protein